MEDHYCTCVYREIWSLEYQLQVLTDWTLFTVTGLGSNAGSPTGGCETSPSTLPIAEVTGGGADTPHTPPTPLSTEA